MHGGVGIAVVLAMVTLRKWEPSCSVGPMVPIGQETAGR
jgi:hypothetical protein